jgi:hypothetical protein
MNRVEALQVMQATEAQRTVGDNWREIIDPSFYTKAGWPNHFVNSLVREHEIDGKKVSGVWHAEFLEALCESMEVDQDQYKSKEGAYSQCKAMALAVWLAFYEEEEKRGKE